MPKCNHRACRGLSCWHYHRGNPNRKFSSKKETVSEDHFYRQLEMKGTHYKLMDLTLRNLINGECVATY